MSAMILYAIGSAILVFAVSVSYPVEAMYLAGGFFMLAALVRWINGNDW